MLQRNVKKVSGLLKDQASGMLKNRRVLLAILTIAMLVLMTGVCLANPQASSKSRMIDALTRFYIRMIPYAVALIVIWGLLWFRKNPGFSTRERFNVLFLILAGYVLIGILVGLILYLIAVYRMYRIAAGLPSAKTAEANQIREAVEIRSTNSDYLEKLEGLKEKDGE